MSGNDFTRYTVFMCVILYDHFATFCFSCSTKFSQWCSYYAFFCERANWGNMRFSNNVRQNASSHNTNYQTSENKNLFCWKLTHLLIVNERIVWSSIHQAISHSLISHFILSSKSHLWHSQSSSVVRVVKIIENSKKTRMNVHRSLIFFISFTLFSVNCVPYKDCGEVNWMNI